MFWDKDGKHCYDASRLLEAHTWCQRMAAHHMSNGYDVVVANTFTRRAELEPYLRLASKYGYTVQEIVCRGEFVNVHGVPDEYVQRKRNQLEL